MSGLLVALSLFHYYTAGFGLLREATHRVMGWPLLIMGAAAFLMIEFLGIPYQQIAIAGIFPAFLYCFGMFRRPARVDRRRKCPS